MKRQRKISIRFYNDREVRAVWDDENDKWWFSVLDIVGAINAQEDYARTRNYWKYLKTKLRKQGSEVVSATNQLKLLAPEIFTSIGTYVSMRLIVWKCFVTST